MGTVFRVLPRATMIHAHIESTVRSRLSALLSPSSTFPHSPPLTYVNNEFVKVFIIIHELRLVSSGIFKCPIFTRQQFQHKYRVHVCWLCDGRWLRMKNTFGGKAYSLKGESLDSYICKHIVLHTLSMMIRPMHSSTDGRKAG